MTNGMRLAIDGWLYIAVGDYGFQKAIGADGTAISHRGAALRALAPDLPALLA